MSDGVGALFVTNQAIRVCSFLHLAVCCRKCKGCTKGFGCILKAYNQNILSSRLFFSLATFQILGSSQVVTPIVLLNLKCPTGRKKDLFLFLICGMRVGLNGRCQIYGNSVTSPLLIHMTDITNQSHAFLPYAASDFLSSQHSRGSHSPVSHC